MTFDRSTRLPAVETAEGGTPLRRGASSLSVVAGIRGAPGVHLQWRPDRRSAGARKCSITVSTSSAGTTSRSREGETEANRSVSRKHAHIAYSRESREYRVRDDGSARGTAVLRQGQTIRVPQGSRGIRLESGDEIVLGEPGCA